MQIDANGVFTQYYGPKIFRSLSTSNWDAMLDTNVCDPYTNADLTLTLKLAFRKVNPPNGAAEGLYVDSNRRDGRHGKKIVKWDRASWLHWANILCTTAQRYWHGKFWLVNNFSSLDFKLRNVTYRPNIWCRFKISCNAVVPAMGPIDAHHIIDVVKLHSDESFFRSHSTLYDHLDTEETRKGWDSRNRPIMQKAHVHEVGHLLGLGHVNEDDAANCPVTNTNATKCYGITDVDKKSVMGAGMQLRKKFAIPWRKAMVKFTSQGNETRQQDWQAELKRHYPRTIAEARANKKIIRRPKR